MNKLDKIINDNYYIGIRDQDGFETLTLTVLKNHPKEAKDILSILSISIDTEIDAPIKRAFTKIRK